MLSKRKLYYSTFLSNNRPTIYLLSYQFSLLNFYILWFLLAQSIPIGWTFPTFHRGSNYFFERIYKWFSRFWSLMLFEMGRFDIDWKIDWVIIRIFLLKSSYKSLLLRWKGLSSIDWFIWKASHNSMFRF
jgi:hypothetical protein